MVAVGVRCRTRNIKWRDLVQPESTDGGKDLFVRMEHPKLNLLPGLLDLDHYCVLTIRSNRKSNRCHQWNEEALTGLNPGRSVDLEPTHPSLDDRTIMLNMEVDLVRSIELVLIHAGHCCNSDPYRAWNLRNEEARNSSAKNVQQALASRGGIAEERSDDLHRQCPPFRPVREAAGRPGLRLALAEGLRRDLDPRARRRRLER